MLEKNNNSIYDELIKAKKQLEENGALELYTYNKNTGGVGVASFVSNKKEIMVFEGNPDGSDDTIMSYDEFINNYKFVVCEEMEDPFKDINI